jgi:transcriptional regulator with XRE-family HTH domain
VPLARLVAAREDAGITLRMMATRLGVPLVWLWRRERGEALFPLPLLERYAAITGLDLDDPESAAA